MLYIINNKNLHLKQIMIIEQSIQFLYFELIHGFLLFSFDHRTNVTILVPKCISSISYEEVKSMIPGFAGFCLSFVALEKEECEHVSFAGVILLVHL